MSKRFVSSELVDLDGRDPGWRVGVNVGHASTNRAVAHEADDLDDLSYLRKFRAGVLVELVDRTRVLQGERDVAIARLSHNSTMAGWR